MASVNKAIIVGKLGRDPEMRSMPSGDQIATLSVATSERWKDKQTGENKEETEWHRVVFFGKTAEVCAKYLTKGSEVYIEGSIKTRKWTDQSGQERYSTEIRGDRMQMCGPRPDGAGQGGGGGQQRQQQQPQQQRQAPQQGIDDDLPF